jgi:hypothetical protein
MVTVLVESANGHSSTVIFLLVHGGLSVNNSLLPAFDPFLPAASDSFFDQFGREPGYFGISESRLIPQCGHCGEVPRIRPLATQKPTLRRCFRQLRHGTSNRLQNAAMTTAPMSTAKSNLSTNILGPEVTRAPANRRNAAAPLTVLLARRIRYKRIVTSVHFCD